METNIDEIKKEIIVLEDALESAETEQEKQGIFDIIKELKSKLPKEETEIIVSDIQPVEDQNDIEEIKKYSLSYNDFYKQNPDKVLGEIKVETNRFGKEIEIVIGDISNLQAANLDYSLIKSNDEGEKTNSQEDSTLVDTITDKSEKSIARKTVQKKRKSVETEVSLTADIASFEETYANYNKNISLEELRVFIWYKEMIGQPLSQKWYDLAEIDAEYQITTFGEKHWLDEKVRDGLLYYYDGTLLPAYLYLAENIYEKYIRLIKSEGADNSGMDATHIIETWGQSVYDNQVAALNKVYSELYDNRLVINEQGDSLKLVPYSEFCKNFMITSLSDEEPFKINLTKKGSPEFIKESRRYWDQKEVNSMSLTDAFKYWMKKEHDNIVFKKGVSWVDIIEIYINQKQMPKTPDGQDKTAWKAEWERKKERTRIEGERIFNIFLNEQVKLSDKVKIEFIWNKQYNNYVPINYNKVPIAFSLNKTYDIRPEKRDAAAFLFNQGSGCLAYDVGVGKGNLLTSDILTPNGYVKMGTIKVGDSVIGKNGQSTKVIGVYPLGKIQCYKVIFSDGSYTEVSDEHLWNVQTINYRSKYPEKWDVVMTKDILDSLYNYRGDYQYSIPMVDAVQFNEQKLPIHPYLMGLLIGDGCLSGEVVGISNPEKDIIGKIKLLLPNSVELRGKDGKDWNIARKENSGKNEVLDILRDLKLIGTKSNTKFIPEIYKINSIQNRIELLRGLLDSYGYIDNRNNKSCILQYTTVSSRLRDDFVFLVQSFGGTCNITEKLPKYTYKGEKKIGQLAYTITIRLPKNIIPVSSEKQVAKFVEKTKYHPVRFIKAIEDIGFQEAQCIKVDAKDELYVCDNFIVTHNTPAAIFIIKQYIESGYSKRPMIVVPNQTYRQWISEIKTIMPDIFINDLYNLGQEYQEELWDENNNVSAVKENSITLLTYEGLERLGFNEITEGQIFNQLYDILNQDDVDEAQKGNKSEKDKSNFYQRLQKLIGKGLKGAMVNIEDIGTDFICFDEAHAMKKIFTSVKGNIEEDDEGSSRRGKTPYKINSGSPSGIGLKGFMMAQYILRNNNYRNILLLTATPFTNSPLEIFSMLSLVAYKQLQDTDLNSISNFFDNYIVMENQLVVTATMSAKYKSIVTGFRNVSSLQKLIKRYFDYKDANNIPKLAAIRPVKWVLPYINKSVDGVTVKLSDEERVETYIPLSDLQETLMKDIVAYGEGKLKSEDLIRSSRNAEIDTEEEIIDESEDALHDEDEFDVDESNMTDHEKAGVRIIKSIKYSQNLTLSPYLYTYSGLRNPSYLEYVNTSPKLKYVMECIKSVKKYHEDKGEEISGQIIYMNTGIKYFHLLKEYLVEVVGYKPYEVGVIYSQMKGGKEAKENIKNLFLGLRYNNQLKAFEPISDSERIKVLIGSGTIREGMNLQKKSTILYNCFLDWNPTDVVQLHGRIFRQGNEFKNVRIVNPLMINSADIFLFQKLEEKTKRINQIWNTDNKTNVLKLEEFSPAELKYALIKDPKVIAEFQLQEQNMKLEDDIASENILIKKFENIIEKQKDISNYINEMKEFLIEYRPKKFNENLTEDQKIKMIAEVLRTQKDADGLKMVYFNEKQDYDKKGIKYSEKSPVSKPYWFDDANIANRLLQREERDYFKPRNLDINKCDKYIKEHLYNVKKLEEQLTQLKSDENKAELIKEIVKIKEKEKLVEKSIPQLVNEFEKLNYLLSIKFDSKETGAVQAEEFNCLVLDENKEIKIDVNSIDQLENCISKLPSTKSLNSINGEYTDERKKLHEAIYKKYQSKKHCVDNDTPIAILTGGSPASGKTTFLKTYSDYLTSDKLYKIDADEIRGELPEYKGWNSQQTHEETRDIVRDYILSDENIGKPCKFDLIYDGTMNNTKNYLPLIGRLKSLGYKVFIVYINNITYEEAIKRSLERFKNSKDHRYVPRAVIKDFFSKGKEALNELKAKVDGYLVVDGSDRQYNIIEQGGEEIPKDREYGEVIKGGAEAANKKTKLRQEKEYAEQKIEKAKKMASKIEKIEKTEKQQIEKQSEMEKEIIEKQEFIAKNEFLNKKINSYQKLVKLVSKDKKVFLEKKIKAFELLVKLNEKKMACGGSFKKGGDIGRYTNTDKPEFSGNVWAMLYGEPTELKIIDHIANTVYGSENLFRHEYIVVRKDGKFKDSFRISQNAIASTKEELLEMYNNQKFADGVDGLKSEFNCKFNKGGSIDKLNFDVPLMIRLMEYAREDAKTDMDLHVVSENAVKLSKEKDMLTMADYDAIISGTGQFMQGGSITSRRFTRNDFDRLLDDGLFYADNDGDYWSIKLNSNDKVVGKYYINREVISFVGSKKLDNPLVEWLQKNSFVSNSEYQKLECGGSFADGGIVDKEILYNNGKKIDDYYEGKQGNKIVEVYEYKGDIYFVRDNKIEKLTQQEAIDNGWGEFIKNKFCGGGNFADGGGVDGFGYLKLFEPLSAQEEQKIMDDLKSQESQEIREQKERVKNFRKAEGKDWNDSVLRQIKTIKNEISDFVEYSNKNDTENAIRTFEYALENIEFLYGMEFGARKYAINLEKKLRQLYDVKFIKNKKIDKFCSGGSFADGGSIDKMTDAEVEKLYDDVEQTQILASDFDIDDVREMTIQEKRDFLKDYYKDSYKNGGEHDQNIIDFIIPDWAVPYLLKGNESGLSEERLDNVKKWKRIVLEQYGNTDFIPKENPISLGYLNYNDIERDASSECYKLSIVVSDGFGGGGGVGEMKTNKKWRVTYINQSGRKGEKEITLGRLSDREDVKQQLRRMTDLNIMEVLSIDEITHPIDLLPENNIRRVLLENNSYTLIRQKTGILSRYDIDGIRTTAIQILNRDGDDKYSIENIGELLKQAKDEYFENKWEKKFQKPYLSHGGSINRHNVWQSNREDSYNWDVWINDEMISGTITINKNSSNYDVEPSVEIVDFNIKSDSLGNSKNSGRLFEQYRDEIKDFVINEIGRQYVFSEGQKFADGGKLGKGLYDFEVPTETGEYKIINDKPLERCDADAFKCKHPNGRIVLHQLSLEFAFKKGGSIRTQDEIKKLVLEKSKIVDALTTPKQVADMWNKNASAVVKGYSSPMTEQEAMSENSRSYLKSLLVENELSEAEYEKYFDKGGSVENEMEDFINGLQKKSQIMVIYPQTYEKLSEEFNNEIIDELGEQANDREKYDELLNKKVDETNTSVILSLISDEIIDEFKQGGNIGSKIFQTKQKIYTDLHNLAVKVDKTDNEKAQKIVNAASSFYDKMPDYNAGGGVENNAEMFVSLSAEPNPDFDKNSHEGTIRISEKKVKINSLKEAAEICQKFIKENDLGGGNWNGGQVYVNGKKVAYISYNGRIWDNNHKPFDYDMLPIKHKNGGNLPKGIMPYLDFYKAYSRFMQAEHGHSGFPRKHVLSAIYDEYVKEPSKFVWLDKYIETPDEFINMLPIKHKKGGNLGSGLIVYPSSKEDWNKISDMLTETNFYADDYPSGNYWFFPEEESNYDNLEKELNNVFNEREISARFEGVFKAGGGVRAAKQYNRDVEKYKWFVVDKKAKKAISGWEYKSDAEDAKKDYDGDTNYTVYSERMLKIMNIENPKERWYERRDDGTKYSKGSTVSTKTKERCDTTMPIQSLIFERKKFSKAKAKKWAKERGYKIRTETTANSYRMRQSNPKNFKAPFRTIIITDGIKAVVACKK